MAFPTNHQIAQGQYIPLNLPVQRQKSRGVWHPAWTQENKVSETAHLVALKMGRVPLLGNLFPRGEQKLSIYPLEGQKPQLKLMRMCVFEMGCIGIGALSVAHCNDEIMSP